MVILASIVTSFAQTTAEVKNVDFSVSGDVVTISYDLISVKEGERYTISAILATSSGKSIKPKTVSGDIGNNISAGLKKKIIWDAKKDNVVLVEDAWIELSAVPFVPNTKLTASDYKDMGNALLLSTLLPGLGNSKLAGGNNAWLIGIAGYSCLAVGVSMTINSKTQYNQYKNAIETIDRNSLYNESKSSALTGKIFFISAGAIWICDLIITGIQVKPSNTITALQKRISIAYSYDMAIKKPVFMFRYKF